MMKLGIEDRSLTHIEIDKDVTVIIYKENLLHINRLLDISIITNVKERDNYWKITLDSNFDSY